MTGIITLLLLSWLALHLSEKVNLHVLIMGPLAKILRQFAIGFGVTATLCSMVQYLELVLTSSSWQLNETFKLPVLANFLWWDLRSVITEELVFRGAFLYILIKKLSTKYGLLLSATAFGIYHWFSFGIVGHVTPMIVVFIGTGLMGYAWALAFSKTSSMAMPTGLHLGWNFTHNTIFSKGPLGQGLVTTTGGENISDWFSLVGLWIVPLVMLLMVKYLLSSSEATVRDHSNQN